MAVDRAENSGWPHRRRFAVATTTLCLLSAAAAGYGADLIGNGMSDVLWRLPAGNPLIWEMSGLSLQGQVTVSNTLDAGSAIVGTGKFFGNGSPDAIAWVSSSDQLTLWLLGNDGSVQQSCTNTIAPDLDFLGIGDIDGDGTDDILWRSATDGSVSAYLMNGCATTPQALALQSIADPSWTFAGAGDINGDDYADLIWQDSQSGNVIIWLSASGGVVTQEIFPENAQSGWKIAAIGDFDGNGKADLLWRDPASQALVLWSSNGSSFDVAPVEPASSETFANPDDIFSSGFETGTRLAPALSANWTILGASDFDQDGNADILLADGNGDVAIWLMQGATVRATGLFPPTSPDMPLPGITGWRLPLDRPAITKVGGEVMVNWPVLPGSPSYAVYASTTNDPATTGSVVSTAPPPLVFSRSDPGFASNDRYFTIGAAYHGVVLPPSKEAYIVEFTLNNLPYWGAMSVADFNGDGCMDILGALGNCNGTFSLYGESQVGLSALRAPGRAYRDIRFADFNGDGILDAVANTYSCDVPECGANDTNSQFLLFFGNGDGTFAEDTAFTALNVPGGGFGETIVVADFNNDGNLDIFLPQYTAYDPGEHSFLLLNDGHGHFTDVSDIAGVAMRNVPLCGRPEGAQAVDLNSDGLIDLYAGSHLFMNQRNNPQGIPLFQNMGPTIDSDCNTIATSPWGLPENFDEGAKFIDMDNSGQLTLVLNTVFTYFTNGMPAGLEILKFDGIGQFSEIENLPPGLYMNQSFGIAAADVDGSGLTALVVAGGCDNDKYAYPNEYPDPYCYGYGNPHDPPQMLVNRSGQFEFHDFSDDGLTLTTRDWSDLQTQADFNYSGTADFVSRFTYFPPGAADSEGETPTGYLSVSINRASSPDIITVSVLGPNGEQNQQGRVVRVTPDARPDVTMTQVVDGGSGYMSNGPYDLTFATPYFGAYTVSVRFAGATYTAVARIGDHVTMSANGTYAIQPAR